MDRRRSSGLHKRWLKRRSTSWLEVGSRKLEQQQEAEQYVFKMISQESHWTNRKTKDQTLFIKYLVDHCRTGFARGSMTACVPSSSSLTSHLKIMHSMHYAHLCQLLACGNDPSNPADTSDKHPTASAETAVLYVIDLLKKLQISKNSKEEQLLPLLSLFCSLATMTPTLSNQDLANAYQAVQPFYLWPQPYCEVARDVLDFIFTEQRCPGIHFRRLLLNEHQIEVPRQEDITKINSEFVHVIVDKSAPRGEYFAASFESQSMDDGLLKRKLLMHIFYSVFGYTSQKDLTELEADLENCHEPDLSHLCYHGLTACEEAAMLADQEQGRKKLNARLQHLKEILSQFRGRQSHSSLHSRSSTEMGATVEEVYSVLAKPMLWLPPWRPHELHVFDGEVSDSSGAESALQSILTEHQGRRRKDSVPTSADLKHLRGLAGRAQRLKSDSGTGSMKQKPDTPDKSASLPPEAVSSYARRSSDDEPARPVSSRDGEDFASSSFTSHGSRLLDADAIISEVMSSSSAESTPKHNLSPEKSLQEESPHSSVPSSMSGDTGPLDDQSSGSSQPGSASTTLKPEGSSLQVTVDEAEQLDKENSEFLAGSSSTSSDSSLRSPPTDSAPSQSAPQPSLLKPSSSGMTTSRSMDFTSGRPASSAGSSRFNFDTVDFSHGKMAAAKSSASLDKAENLPSPSLRKRSSYSEILKRRGSHKAVMSRKNPIVKVMFAGDDRTVRLVSQAYVQLRRKFKFLFEGLDVKFYYVPLSSAGGGGGLVDTVPIQVGGVAQLPRRFHLYEGATISSSRTAGTPELLTSLLDLESSGSDELPQNGGDVWFGRFLAHLDGWYERNLMLSVHGSLRVLPQEALDSEAILNTLDDATSDSGGPTPRTVISDAVFSYCRQAQYEVKCKLYQVEVTDATGRTETYVFLNRVEMIIPAKTKRAPEIKLQVQKVGLDEVLQGPTTLPVARYWGLRLSNIPHPSDICPTNIESLGLEMTLTDSSANRGTGRSGSGMFKKSLRGGIQPEATSFHVAHVEAVATSLKDTFSVTIDSDVCCQNIVSFQVRPCSDSVAAKTGLSHPRTMTGLGARPSVSTATMSSSPGSRRQSQVSGGKADDQSSDISLPIMIFWPPEL
ncbi:uncharacterized protein LOC135819539 isoform X2 [Sycon ciliatum]|uniref:uncharacterized protein LOC135819539 isoform X2 n=1 Tax=Sycon ciliatum TaxID=27933 RepID=UPI0031F6760A